jgi:pilus assembly protein CpaF
MSLRERLQESRGGGVPHIALVQPGRRDEVAYHELKSRLHRELLDRVDLSVMEGMSAERLREEIKALVERMLLEEGTPISELERRQIVFDIQNEVMGLGPLEPLLADPTISDILVNTCRQVYVERAGRLELTDVRFGSNEHLMKIIEKIVSRIGRRIDESSPMVDARLPDGSRVNAIVPPLALDGPLLSIRRFAVVPMTAQDFVDRKTMTEEMNTLLCGLVQARVNMLISGGTGTGKTTFLNILSASIPEFERIVTIEDSAELQLQQPHVVRLETRPANVEGRGEITQRSLVRNSLRMRPDRIIVGEVRGGEVLDMLQAMNTGHDGSMTTIHANSPRDAMTRLENMIGMSGINLPPKAMRHQISSAISVVLQMARLRDGRRKVVSLQEITGMEDDVIAMQEIFAFHQTGITPDGAVQGHFRASGIRPRFCDRLAVHGIAVRDDIFDPNRLYE